MENSQTKQSNENEGQKTPLNLVGTSKRRGDMTDQQARSFYDQAKQTAGHAYDAVTEKAADKLDKQRSTVSDGLSAVADSVRQAGSHLGSSTRMDSGLADAAAKYSNTAARKLENVAGYFENKDVRAMVRDVESFARRNPAVFLGAAFGLGFLVARFLKSMPQENYRTAAGKDFASAERDNLAASKSVANAGYESDRISIDFKARPQ